MARKQKLLAYSAILVAFVVLAVLATAKNEWFRDQLYFYRLSKSTDGKHIAGIVFSHDGRRVAGAKVHCTGKRLPGPRNMHQYGGEEQERLRTETDASGRFTLTGLDGEGHYILRFSADDNATFIAYELAAGTVERFTFPRGAFPGWESDRAFHRKTRSVDGSEPRASLPRLLLPPRFRP